MLAIPAPTPVTKPEEFTVATPGLSVTHVPPLPEPTNVSEPPIHKGASPDTVPTLGAHIFTKPLPLW
jgi:hypothetical protein